MRAPDASDQFFAIRSRQVGRLTQQVGRRAEEVLVLCGNEAGSKPDVRMSRSHFVGDNRTLRSRRGGG